MTLRHFAAGDGARLAFRDEGSGLPLLALAGLTRNAADFDFLAPKLAEVRLIRPDYRGRGASEWTGPATYTVAQEAADALALLDHLGIRQAAVLGTSRGGLIGMVLAATAHDRLLGLCLNDIGPEVDPVGMALIRDYVGRAPSATDLETFALQLPHQMPGFRGVSPERWREVAERLCEQVPGGLRLRYDPALREALAAALDGPRADLWPLFDACAGLQVALIRGAGSSLLSSATVAEMRRRRPDMLHAEVPDRGHVPFLDEPESLALIHAWLGALR